MSPMQPKQFTDIDSVSYKIGSLETSVAASLRVQKEMADDICKLNESVTKLTAAVEHLNTSLNDMEPAITSLTRWKQRTIGWASGASIVSTGILFFISDKLKNIFWG